MLGITTPDAIAFGMLLLAVLSAMRGKVQGEAAKTEATRAAVGVSIAGAIVQANQFDDYVKTLDKHAIAMKAMADAMVEQNELNKSKFTNTLEEMAEKVDRLLDKRR